MDNEETGRVLVLECPPGLHLGLDYCTWTAGELVKGLKAVPVGAHYLYSSTGEDKEGGFVYIGKGTVAVRKWAKGLARLDKEDEELFERAGSEGDFDLFLGDFPNSKAPLWRQLTQFLTPSLLARLTPAAPELPTCPNYTLVPHHRVLHGMSASQITASNFDKSQILLEVLARERITWECLIGELQYAFISLLLGESLTGFEQWKSLLILLLSSPSALHSLPALYLSLIPVLYQQFLQLGDISQDPFIQTSFIPRLTCDFLALLADPTLQPALYTRGQKLQRLIGEIWGGFDPVEDDEDRPVVVELSQEQVDCLEGAVAAVDKQ